MISFRDSEIAASLKPGHRAVHLIADRPFRDHLIAASLKQRGDAARRQVRRPFRDQLIAASLKPASRPVVSNRQAPFPR